MKSTARAGRVYARCTRCWTPIILDGRLEIEGEFLCRQCSGPVRLVQVDPYQKPSHLARWEEA